MGCTWSLTAPLFQYTAVSLNCLWIYAILPASLFKHIAEPF